MNSAALTPVALLPRLPGDARGPDHFCRSATLAKCVPRSTPHAAIRHDTGKVVAADS